mmetsp:Transcript_150149/g.482610  ORF Transcript_150149/g.482610 Transcript_150149/m.482610 type:complete len:211 (+) Transcript_150149:78-710(+)
MLAFFLWRWGTFLDGREHDPARTRAAMLLVLAVSASLEWRLSGLGWIDDWVFWVVMIANFWGGLDAVLRFPAAHSLESAFASKQLCLLLTKSLAFAAGIAAFETRLATWVAYVACLCLVWALPVGYAMALPLDPKERVMKDDSYDVDVLLRLWQVATCPMERRTCVAGCRRLWQRGLASTSRASGPSHGSMFAAIQPRQCHPTKRVVRGV